MLAVANLQPLKLHFVPEPYQDDFIKAVFSFYEQHAQALEWKPYHNQMTECVPNAIRHIASSNAYFYIISCYCYEAGDPLAWKKNTTGDDWTMAMVKGEFEALCMKYAEEPYQHLCAQYVKDTLAVLDWYHMVYRTQSANPDSSCIVHNSPLTGVW